MANRPNCEECQAILDELARAKAEMQSVPALRKKMEAMYRMVGGTEEDVELAEEVLAKFRPQDPRQLGQSLTSHPKVQKALQRMVEHYKASRHLPHLSRR